MLPKSLDLNSAILKLHSVGEYKILSVVPFINSDNSMVFEIKVYSLKSEFWKKIEEEKQGVLGM